MQLYNNNFTLGKDNKTTATTTLYGQNHSEPRIQTLTRANILVNVRLVNQEKVIRQTQAQAC